MPQARCADIILANRAYLDHNEPPGAGPPDDAGNGGLLAALRPVIAPWDGASGTTWIGAGRGAYDRAFTDADGLELIETARGPLRHQRLYFDDATWERHYGTVANSFLWPLLHLVREPLPDLAEYYPAPVAPTAGEWAAYRRVNRAFAAAAVRQPLCGTAWVHDYQLGLVPALLRELDFAGRIGFFLHTPFPELAVVEKFLDPAASERFREFVAGMLGADVAGFQSPADVERFRRAAIAVCGAEATTNGLRYEGRDLLLAAYPVGIDVEETLAVAREGELPGAATAVLRPGLPFVVGLERSDFTKGIPERLEAVAAAFDCGLSFAYLGAAAPTREGVAVYARLEETISAAAAVAERAAARAGGTFLHARAALPWPCVAALLREADVIFTSSLADGMNLVPLQAAIAQSLRPPGERGVIIAGRDAGVANVLAGFEGDGLVPVDPLDQEGMVQTLCDAVAGKLPRISDRLIEEVKRGDARQWATRFVADLEAA